jgi:hypothetical protein
MRAIWGDSIKKWMRAAIGIMLSVLLLQGLSLPVVGQAEMPEFNIGDRWEYLSTTLGMNMSMTFEISEQTTIDVNGTNYNVWAIEADSTIDFLGYYTAESTGYNYHLISNMAVVKSDMTMSVIGIDSTIIITYEPPKADIDFPLTIGKTWTSSFTETTQTDVMGETEYSQYNSSFNYTVIGMETITVEAGTFECYKIEADDGEGTLVTIWYSSEVKNKVKEVTSSWGTIDTETQLVDYQFAGENGDEDEEGFNLFAMPYLLLFLLIIIVVIVVVVVAARGKGKKAKAQAPPQIPQQPQGVAAPAAAAAAPQASQSAPKPLTQQYPCPDCRQPLTYVEQYRSWYCKNCKKYQ